MTEKQLDYWPRSGSGKMRSERWEKAEKEEAEDEDEDEWKDEEEECWRTLGAYSEG